MNMQRQPPLSTDITDHVSILYLENFVNELDCWIIGESFPQSVTRNDNKPTTTTTRFNIANNDIVLINNISSKGSPSFSRIIQFYFKTNGVSQFHYKTNEDPPPSPPLT